MPTKPTTETVTPQPFNAAAVEQAVLAGMTAISDGKTKVQPVNAMFPLIATEPKNIILRAFIDGAGLTEKGALTYLYNVRRAVKRGLLKMSTDE